MRRRLRYVSFHMLAAWAVPLCAQSVPTLLAPLYPGAAHMTHPEYVIGNVAPHDPTHLDQSEIAYEARGFYTKDGIEQVRAFYEDRVGALRNDFLYGTTSDPQGINRPIVYSKVLLTYSEVVVILKSYQENPRKARDAGLEILSRLPPNAVSEKNSPYFMPFRNLVNKFGRRPSDLKKVYERFRRLDSSYFLLTDQLSEAGGYRSVDEVLFQNCFVRLEGGISVEERPRLERKINDLMNQNKMDEAIELGRKLNAPTVPGNKDTWDGWVACLEEIEKNSFQTLIRIDLHPGQWSDLSK